MNSESLSFNMDGHRFQGVMSWPASDSKLGALILHPHPLFGGTSEDHVVRFLERILLDHGFVTFRFDFRGTHSHNSEYAGIIGAVQDSLAASRVLLDHTGLQKHAVIGYSFGGSVALLLASRTNPDFLVTLSASLDLAQEGDETLNSLGHISCPIVMFHGTQDSMVPFHNMNALAQRLPSGNIETHTIVGGGHFYMDPAKQQVKDYLKLFLSRQMNG